MADRGRRAFGARRWLGAMLASALALLTLGAAGDGCGGSAGRRLPPEVNGFLKEEDLAALEAAGFPIHEGDEPPLVDGAYLVDSLVVQVDNPGDEDGSSRSAMMIFLSNSDSAHVNLAVGAPPGTAPTPAYLSGEGACFTVFLPVDTGSPGCEIGYPLLLSGCLTSAGVGELQIGAILNKREGDACPSLWEPKGSVVVMGESDGVAARACPTCDLISTAPAESAGCTAEGSPPLPETCTRLDGSPDSTWRKRAGRLQCYRQASGTLCSNVAEILTYSCGEVCPGLGCPLHADARAEIAAACTKEPDTSHRALCVGTKVRAQLQADPFYICQHHATCVEKILETMGISTEYEVWLDPSHPPGHAWDEIATADGVVVADAYNAIYYTCPP